jgi:homoserine kinase
MSPGFRVRVPASSANLGAAFDAVAVALEMHLDIEVGDEANAAPESHPAVRAFRHAGGSGPISVRSQFPGGRGLGFSGAARVGGVLAARIQRGETVREARTGVLADATELEGHADNVAASLFGGVVAVAGGHAVRVPLAVELAIVVWIPERETSTAGARRLLPESVPFADAAFNVGHTALLVAALAAGDVAALRTATEDRLHQDRRLARVPATHHAMRAALEAGAYAAWLSGSGPSAAAFAEPARAAVIAAALPAEGRSAVLSIDDVGASLIARGES